MSKYYDYEDRGKFYDEARIADGADMMCNMFSTLTKKPMSQIKLLDAGCGTGNYSLAFLESGLGSITMIDASSRMLENAKLKTERFKKNAEICLMTLPTLDFPNESFDVVTFIQVLHHIDSIPSCTEKEVLTKEDYPNLIKSLKQAFRVLTPGGTLMIDMFFEENVDSFWWTSLCPKAAKTMKRLRITKEELIELLYEMTFQDITFVMRPNSTILRRNIYDSIEKIGDSQWRSYLSQYKLVEKSGELENLVNIVEEKVKLGCLSEFKQELNKNLRIYGHHTTVFARKPL